MRTSPFKGKWKALLLTAFAFSIITSCNDDEKPKKIPTVTTAAITEFTTTTAVAGGEITDDGNADITASGVCYSSTNENPTIEDDTTKTTVTEGAFTSTIDDLTSGTTYHVRAYAINEKGVGYGDVIAFLTGNAAPIATNVAIDGDLEIGAVLTADYDYSDAENNTQGETTFTWYSAEDEAGTNETAIEDATASTYTILATDEYKFIRVGVTPKATAGTTTGAEVKSAFVGPVPEAPETVTFIYNEKTVTYEVIVSPVTQRKWLDRNLGAPNKPSSYDDWANYGDLFQWGRGDDGHQRINRGATDAETIAFNGTTDVLSTDDTPSDSKFIVNSTGTRDWRDPQNNSLWQLPEYINNPCPSGWHIPTKTEWEAENLVGKTTEEAFAQLKLTFGGLRYFNNGSFGLTTGQGNYWTSTLNPTEPRLAWSFYSSFNNFYGSFRTNGFLCKCIENQK